MNRKRKDILIICSEFPPLPGGIGNHALNLALNLLEEGYQPTVLTDSRGNDTAEKLYDSSLDFKVKRIKRYQISILTYFSRILLGIILSKSNDTILLTGKFSLWLGGLISLFYSRKFIAVAHGSEVNLQNFTANNLTKKCLNRFDHIIAVSSYTKSFLTELKVPVTVIYNGFKIDDANGFTNTQPKKDKLEIITVGNLTMRKGQHNVIKVIPKLNEFFSSVIYHIVGIPTDKERIQSLANDLNVSDSIKIHGMVSEKKKIDLISSSDLFYMLSEEMSSGDIEGFGIAILEANSLGIPAIGSKGTGIEDAISDNYSGRIVNAKNQHEIVLSTLEIVNDYKTFSMQSKLWSKEFSWSNIIGDYIKIIENVNQDN